MKKDDVYISIYTGYHIVITEICRDWINFKYITGPNRHYGENVCFNKTFLHCFKFSEKFTEEYIIRKIIE